MNTVKKTIHQFKKGDIVLAHGCKFKITENARPAICAGTSDWSPSKGFIYHHEAPSCAVAQSVCIEGYVKGYIHVGGEWTFQGNFLAGEYTVEVQ
jgi:hypothetical protein